MNVDQFRLGDCVFRLILNPPHFWLPSIHIRLVNGMRASYGQLPIDRGFLIVIIVFG